MIGPSDQKTSVVTTVMSGAARTRSQSPTNVKGNLAFSWNNVPGEITATADGQEESVSSEASLVQNNDNSSSSTSKTGNENLSRDIVIIIVIFVAVALGGSSIDRSSNSSIV